MDLNKLNEIQNFIHSVKINNDTNAVLLKNMQKSLNELFEMADRESNAESLIKDYVRGILEGNEGAQKDATKDMIAFCMNNK